MQFTQAVAILVAFATAADAAPNAGAAFTLAQENSGRFYTKSGAAAVRQAYLKYTGSVPQFVMNAGARVNGSVGNDPEPNDIGYLTPIKIGTPARTLMMNIDSGSSDLWVFSNQLPASERKGHAIYAAGKSTSGKLLKGQTWNIQYVGGDGASGNVFADKVSVAGVTVTKQAVEAAQSVSSTFSNNKNADGIFGLAFSKLNTVKPTTQKTWFDNAGPLLKQNVFCADLRKAAPGFFDVGFINKAHYSGKVHYAPIDTSGFWRFQLSGYSVGSGSTVSNAIAVAADTGTSINFLPDAITNDYYSGVNTAYYEPQVAGYIFDCSVNLPSFSIVANGFTRTTPGPYMNYAPVGTVGGVPYCFGGIQSSAGLQGINILGDIFLKSQYVVFDGGNNRIGFANKK